MGRNEFKSGRRLVLTLCLTVALLMMAAGSVFAAQIAYYPLNGSAADLSGNGNNGTLINGATYATGKYGQAVSFDGVNDLVTTTSSVSSPSTVSIALWFKTSSASGHKLIGLEAGPGYFDYNVYVGTDGKLRFGIFDRVLSVLVVTSQNVVTDDVWHHAAAIFQNNILTLYLDGVSQGTLSTNGPNSFTGSWQMGGGQLNTFWPNGSNGYYSGLIDDVRIYDNALSASEVSNLATGLVAHYPFNGNANDESGNGNNGTVVGATLTADRFGNANSAYYFNRNNQDIINLTANSGIPIGNSTYSIAAWFKPTSMGSYGIVGWGNYETTNQVIAIRLAPGGGFNHYWWNNDQNVGSADLSNAWHHVVASFDGTNKYVYLDGVQIASDIPAAGHNVPSAANLAIGATVRTNGWNEYFSGAIDDVHIYNYALSASQISALYSGQMGGSIQGAPLNLNNTNASVTTFAGSGSPAFADGTGAAASFHDPSHIATDGLNVYVADRLNHKIRKIEISTGVATTLAGSGTATFADGTGTGASFSGPNGITTDGTYLYVADTDNQRVRKIEISTGIVTTLAGSGSFSFADGTGTGASFMNPWDITTDGTNLYVADTSSRRIRKIVISTGVVTTLAGSGAGGSDDGTGTAASFYEPYGITTDGANLYVADRYNHKIRKIVISTGVVTTLAGSGTGTFADGTGATASFRDPFGITTDGTNLYVADTGNHRIRRIEIATGAVTTIAGSGTQTFADGFGAAASFNSPFGITTDGTNLYVSDTGNQRIRKIAEAYTVTATATNGSATPSSQVINYNSTASVSGTADTGYYFTGVSGCGGTAQSNSSQAVTTFNYTTGAITSDCTVTATYAIKAFNLSYQTDGTSGATLTGTTPQTINYGSDATAVTANVPTSYHFVNWTGTGGFSTTTANPLTVTNVTADMTITANYAINNYIVNGTFESGNAGFASEYLYAPSNAVTCDYPAAMNGGCYAITNDPNSTHSSFSTFAGHGGSGNMLVANGAPASTYVWQETLNLPTGTNYLFEAYATSVWTGDTSPANLLINIDLTAGCATAANFQSVGSINATANANDWVRNQTSIRTGSSTEICIRMVNNNTALGGNDYAIDDISLYLDTRVPTTVNDTAITAMNAPENISVLTNDTAGTETINTASVDLDPTTPGIQTTKEAIGGTFSVSAGVVTFTPTAGFAGTATCTYQVSSVGGVPSNVSTITVTVNPIVTFQTDGTAGSSLTGTTPQTVTYGGNATAVTANVPAGYHFVNWTGTGGFSTTTDNPLTVTNVTAGMTVTANYAINAVPGAPVIGKATAGNGQASVLFSAPASDGGSPITGYTVTSNPDNITAAGTSSPITVTGLTNKTAYTFTVTATNSVGTGPASAASNTIIAGLQGGSIQGTALNLTGTNAFVSTFAGSGAQGSTDGIGTAASFKNDMGVTTDGTYLYVADTVSNKIRKILIATGEVTTLAGSGAKVSADGIGASASFNGPWGIATDGTNLYVTDADGLKIRKVVIATGEVTTLAGSGQVGSANGIGAAASFNWTGGITTDGTNVYVTDSNNLVRRIVIATGEVTTLAGSGAVSSQDGTGTAASFNWPLGLTTDGVNLYVCEGGQSKIRKIVIATGEVTTLAGSGSPGSADGTGTAASFHQPNAITSDGTNLYVTDQENQKIRKIVIATGEVTTLAGSGTAGSTDGIGTVAKFAWPFGITTDGTNLFVADNGNNKIREISVASYTVTATATGTGAGTVASDTGGISYSYPANNAGTTPALNSGTAVTLTATASAGTTVSWTTCNGSADGNGTGSATCTYSSLDGNETAQATFTLNQYNVSASSSGNGNGSVTSATPLSIDHGSTASFTVAPATNYLKADSVGGDCPSGFWTGNSYTTGTITGACSVVFSFVKITYPLTLSEAGSGFITASASGYSSQGCAGNCSFNFDSGTVVTLTVTPASSSFSGNWAGACTGTGICQVTMDGPKSVSASFLESMARTSGFGFNTIGNALSNLLPDAELSIKASDYYEELVLSQPMPFTLKGGYDSTFSTVIGMSTIRGLVSINGGAVTMQNIIIQ